MRESSQHSPSVGLVSYQELSQCWLLSVREVMLFARKYSIPSECLQSEPKKKRNGFDSVIDGFGG